MAAASINTANGGSTPYLCVFSAVMLPERNEAQRADPASRPGHNTWKAFPNQTRAKQRGLPAALQKTRCRRFRRPADGGWPAEAALVLARPMSAG
jgi:hypothetical protein